MARATKAAAARPAPEPEEDDDEFPLAYLLTKEPSDVHVEFCEYIEDMTGKDVADPKTVQLVISQYQKFQKTPEHQEKLRIQREASDARAAEKDAKPVKATLPAKTTRTRGKAASAAEDDAEEAPRPAGRARRGQVATPPPAKRTTSRRRPVAVAAEVD